MEGKRASGVGGIVTWLWWLVFGLWCPHTPLLLPIHSLALAFVAPCVVDWVIGWRGVVWLSEERAGRQRHTKTATRKQQTPQHTRVVAWRVVCAMSLWGGDSGGVSESVVMECGGMVD